MKRFNLKISGRVQGVGYRYFTQRTAEELGVCGWVKNLPDGRVESEVQGDSDKLELMLQTLKRGPSFGYVSDIVKNEIPFESSDSEFEIRY